MNSSHDDALPFWKRALDLIGASAALPFLATLTLLIGILIKIRAPGPIFFRQERVGYRGKRFRIYKFRTMHAGASTAVHQAHFATLVKSNTPMQKMDARGDSRLIPGGWLLRASGLDELPQIINVFLGEMSIVGPRPCIPYEYENYSAEQRKRFNSLPGITGLWQVSGKNRTTFERMIELDISYSANRALATDLKIIVLTPPALLIQLYDTRIQSRRKSTPTTTFARDGQAEVQPLHASS